TQDQTGTESGGLERSTPPGRSEWRRHIESATMASPLAVVATSARSADAGAPGCCPPGRLRSHAPRPSRIPDHTSSTVTDTGPGGRDEIGIDPVRVSTAVEWRSHRATVPPRGPCRRTTDSG